jgi:RNA methyltransferase, TrmH family
MLSKNQIKYLNTLRLGKFRDSNRVFIAEGVKLIDDLVISHFSIQIIYGTPAWIDSHQRLIASQEFVIQEVEEEELKKISSLVTPNEVLALVSYPDPAIPSPDTFGNIILLLDRIQDPGNLGTIIRTADWFGIRHIFCSHDTVDVYNPKVVQATMGSICRVSVHYVDLKQQITSLGDTWKIYGTISDGENIYTAEPEFPAAILIGNESKGISEEYFPLLTYRVGIPSRSKGAESLNASVAAGIFCSEFSRRLDKLKIKN